MPKQLKEMDPKGVRCFVPRAYHGGSGNLRYREFKFLFASQSKEMNSGFSEGKGLFLISRKKVVEFGLNARHYARGPEGSASRVDDCPFRKRIDLSGRAVKKLNA